MLSASATSGRRSTSRPTSGRAWRGVCRADDRPARVEPAGGARAHGLSVWVAISAMVWVSVALLTSLNARLRAEAHTDGLTGLLNRTGSPLPPRGSARCRTQRRAARAGDHRPRRLQARQRPRRPRRRRSPAHRARRRLDRLAAPGRPAGTVRRRRVRPAARGRGGGSGRQAPRTARAVAPRPWTAGAVICSDEETLDAAIDRADARLYVAKEPRRNAVDRDRRASSVRCVATRPRLICQTAAGSGSGRTSTVSTTSRISSAGRPARAACSRIFSRLDAR